MANLPSLSALCLLVLLPAALHAADPTVTNVRAAQKTGTKQVEIFYDLSGSTSPVFVSLQISSDGGTTFAAPATALSGAVGAGIALGSNKKITWNAGADWNNQLSNTVKFRVTASDRPPAPDGFALIPAGTFQMGDQSNPLVGYSDELPVHSVYVSAFYMGKYEVTKELWDEVRAWGVNNGYTDLPVGNGSYASKGASHPVHSINWYAMVKWCNARSQKEGLTPCYRISGVTYMTGSSAPDCNWNASGYRLPTEAEWEKAARGGLSGKNFPWGDTINHSNANYRANSSAHSYDTSGYTTSTYHPTYNDGVYPYSSPVGSFAPNGYGLYDMAGNMWEWCWDWYSSIYYSTSPGSDSRGAASGSSRVLRGGGWYLNANSCRAAGRLSYHGPDFASYFVGFRAARSSVP